MSDALFCIEVTLDRADPGAEERIEATLWELGAAGVERQDDTTFSTLVEDPRPRAAGSVRWRVYGEPPENDAAAIAVYREALGDVVSVEGWRLDDLSFLSAWKEHFRPARVSPRVVVHPPWDVPAVEEGTVRVEIEPGMAFGTGTHETTRLCIAALDRLVERGTTTVLDVGCGSGVLAIAAAKLGARRVEAMDNDPDSVRIANENFAVNGVRIEADTLPLSPERGEFDVVVANILPHVLVDLRRELLERLAPDGTLVLSGIVDGKRFEVERAFAEVGATPAGAERAGEWWALEMRR